MKKILLPILSALCMPQLLLANLALHPEEVDFHLEEEKVDITINKDLAEVTGTFTFHAEKADQHSYACHNFNLHLPVYAAEGTPTDEIMPSMTLAGKALKVTALRPDINPKKVSISQGFGVMPKLEGQRVYWFWTHVRERNFYKEGETIPDRYTIKIHYKQKLAGGKLIYTPLISKQKEGKDYGSISLKADRPMTLIDAKQHDFEKQGESLVVEPSHKREIIVDLGQKPQVP